MPVYDVALSLKIEISLVAIDLYEGPSLGGWWTTGQLQFPVLGVRPIECRGRTRLSDKKIFQFSKCECDCDTLVYLIVLLFCSTSTWGTTIVMSNESPLNLLCLWLEWRWFNTNSKDLGLMEDSCQGPTVTWGKSAGVLELWIFWVAVEIRTRHLDPCN